MFQKAQFELVLNSLRLIGIHHPPFIDKFFLRLFDIIPKLMGEFKQMALELILLRCTTAIQDPTAPKDNTDADVSKATAADPKGKGKEKIKEEPVDDDEDADGPDSKKAKTSSSAMMGSTYSSTIPFTLSSIPPSATLSVQYRSSAGIHSILPFLKKHSLTFYNRIVL